MKDDLISRQTAYDTLTARYHHRTDAQHEALRDALSRVPSAQPEIIHCKNCKHWMNGHLCRVWSQYGTINTTEDFYCGHAERREDG